MALIRWFVLAIVLALAVANTAAVLRRLYWERQWLLAMAADRAIAVRWWWRNRRIRAAWLRTVELPIQGPTLSSIAASFCVECGCHVHVERGEPGEVVVMPVNRRDARRVYDALDQVAKQMPACLVLRFRLPRKFR